MGCLIPTKYKAKLPQTLSYPIGAEAISESLKNVPQIDQFSLSFHTGIRLSSLRQSGLHMDYTIFAADYSNVPISLTSSNQFVEQGWYDERWELTVYAVPRQFRATAKKLLLEDGLIRIEKWLTAERTEVWKYGRKRCAVTFNEEDATITIQED